MALKNIIDILKKQSMILVASVGISSFVVLVYAFIKRREKITTDKMKACETVPKIDDPDWIEIGRVEHLYYYPLKSGRGKTVVNCTFTDYGISVEEKGFITLKDRMFLVYDGKNGKFQTGRNFAKLLLVEIFAEDEKSVRLETEGMPSLVFRVPENENNASLNIVECSMWWGERLKCIDCGPEAAAWISEFLTGKSDSDLRIGSAISVRRNILKGPWEKYTRVYKTLRNEDTGYFADIASYMLMTASSLDELNKRLEQNVTFLQFRPNIVVTGSQPFDEDSWEWIKIGDETILRNVKPCPRCSMIKINPETALVDPREPMKTLRSFREQTDPLRVEVDGTAPTMGINCGLYRMGHVQINDKIFIQRSKK